MVTSTPSSHLCLPDRCPRLTPGSVPAGDLDIAGMLPPARLPIRHSSGRGVGRPPFCHSQDHGLR